ncbi:dual specificity protein phosphatase 1-like isoform X2 [Chenopodium quinoa]|uniref:dual specificity protein phosphatase 1-like isoform X2 n=1 Tax=Chenopodium quinoa TaxID=63459 RepID=UPI000B77392A|nr:dual specificity protein phosphatase 1-like isoform X2 [Chenopodium quinoa]
MNRLDESYKDRVKALWRAICATKFVNDDNEPCQIEEGLFVGSAAAANNKAALKQHNITHILTVAGYIRPAHRRDFTYKIIEVVDTVWTDLAQYFDECIDFIDEAKRSGGGVLVHCFAGKSRSVTIILAYLIKKHGMTLSQALEYVRSKRRQASPNAGFLQQLQKYEQSLQGFMDSEALKTQKALALQAAAVRKLLKNETREIPPLPLEEFPVRN